MEILFENYVTFIDGGTSDGVGFFVGNFFITAGHVFNEDKLIQSTLTDRG